MHIINTIMDHAQYDSEINFVLSVICNAINVTGCFQFTYFSFMILRIFDFLFTIIMN